MSQALNSPNFAFLAVHDPLLVRLAAQAEVYVFTDPETSLFKLRSWVEALARQIAAVARLPDAAGFALLGLLRRLNEKGYLPRKVADLLHSSHCNNAARPAMSVRPKGQTIQIYLPSGDSSGIRIAEMTTRLVQVIWVPRLRLADAAQRQELKRVGCYLLLRQHATPGEPDLYIGESEDVLRRLGDHQDDKKLPGWDVAIAIVAKDGSFTKVHGLMLQHLAYQRSNEVGRYRTDQKQRPPEPKISDALRDDCHDALDQADFLCALLGVPVFAHVATGAGQPVFHITTKTGADAKGRPTDEGFIVLAGSVCVDGIRDSAPPYVPQTRERMLADGILARQGKALIFARDHAFDSPSGAAAIVVGGAANGWDAWTSADGRSLHESVRVKDASQ